MVPIPMPNRAAKSEMLSLVAVQNAVASGAVHLATTMSGISLVGGRRWRRLR